MCGPFHPSCHNEPGGLPSAVIFSLGLVCYNSKRNSCLLNNDNYQHESKCKWVDLVVDIIADTNTIGLYCSLCFKISKI